MAELHLERPPAKQDVATATFVDLFAGAGGLSYGLTDAGWVGLLALDSWADAVESYRQAFDAKHPVHEVNVGDATKSWFLRHLAEKPSWIVGGPPCQGYSTIGKRLRNDPKNYLFQEFVRVVHDLEPDGFLLENVIGMKDMRFVDEVKEEFEALDYAVACHVLRAADYGVPQLRHRVVFVGHRDWGYFRGPERTHQPDSHVSVWEAIGDLPELGPGESATGYEKPPQTSYQAEMRIGSESLQGHEVSKHPPELVRAISFIPDGGNRRSIPDEYQPSSGYHNSYSRLNSRAPAVAVSSNMGKPSGTRCIHPFQHRGLTAREGARLQSFPDRFHWSGGLVSQRLQIANAVPPRLAEAVGRAILDPARWGPSPSE